MPDDSQALKRERLDCPSGKFQPIVVFSNPDFDDEAEEAREILEEAFAHLDPLEPFDRMAKAIDVLREQDKRFHYLAGMLEHVAKNKNPEANIFLVGQEINDVTAVLAELNFILHGIKNAKVYIGDSLLNPKFEERLREFYEDGKADKVVANPPWNRDGYGEKTLKKNSKYTEIFKYGFTPAQSADWAWIQLFNYYAKYKAGIVIDSGALFRGGREAQIRAKFVKIDLIDAVILLPEKIFYNTQAPGVIIVFNKNKPEERKNKILFINASQEYIPHPEVRRLNKLSDENIKKIANIYREYKEVEGFSRIVDLEEIERNDFNLNVSLYVSPIAEEENIDLEEEFKKLEELNKEYLEKYEKVRNYIKEIIKIV